MACDETKTLLQLLERFGSVLDRRTLSATLERFVEEGLMLERGNSYLSLAIPMGTYSPAKPLLEKLLVALDEMGSTGRAKDHSRRNTQRGMM